MSVAILRPNGSATGGTVGSVPSPTIAGTGAQLGDQSDATYVTTTWNQAAFLGNHVDAPMEPLTADPATVTQIIAHARVSSPVAGSPTLRWMNSGSVTFSHPILFVSADLSIPGGPDIVDVSAVVADTANGTYYSTWSILDAATMLTGSDVFVEVTNSAGTDAQMTVYEVWLEVVSLSPCFQTLASTWAGGDNILTTFSSVYGLLGPYSGPGSTVLDLTMDFTATSAAQSEINYVGVWGGWDGSTVHQDLAVTSPFTIVADGAPHTYSHSFTDAELFETTATIRDVLAAGNTALRFELGGGPGDLITITDATLRVGHKCVMKIPPCQVYPRDDDQGAGTAAVWPPPSSSRPGSYY